MVAETTASVELARRTQAVLVEELGLVATAAPGSVAGGLAASSMTQSALGAEKTQSVIGQSSVLPTSDTSGQQSKSGIRSAIVGALLVCATTIFV